MGFNKGLLIASLVITIAFAVIGSLLLDLADNYDIDVDEKYEDIFDEYSDSKELYQTNQQIIEGGEINVEGQDQAVYKNVIVASKNMQSSGKLMTKVLEEIPSIIPIDVAIIGTIAIIILTLSLFGFIAFVAGRSP